MRIDITQVEYFREASLELNELEESLDVKTLFDKQQ